MAKIRKKLSNKKTAQKGSKKPPTRKYNNLSRSNKSAKTQQSILEALVALLVERRGGDVQLSEVAKKTGITERTIYRFYKDKQSLHQAMDKYLMSFLQAGAEQLQTLDFVGFGKNAYKIFDRHDDLVAAYVLSPFGHEARSLFRKKLNQAMIARIADENGLQPKGETLKRLAVITSLVNAKIWYDIKSDYAFSGEDMADTIGWALKTLLDSINRT